MKIKRIMIAAFLMALTFLLSGCSKFGIEIQDLITPPDPTGELYEIRQALYSYAGEDITLRYPKSGNWRSAFIVEDIDLNGVEDALAFYSTLSNEGTTVMHINLITNLEGRWVSVSDNEVESSSIESVEFADLNNDQIAEIIVCWKIPTSATDKLTVYNFSNGGLTQVINADSTYYTVCNLNEGPENELVIIANNSIAKKASATVYRIEKHGVINIGECPLDVETTEYYSATLSKLADGRPALYIDAAKSTLGTVTEVIYIADNGAPANMFVAEGEKINTQTLRSSNARCYDVNEDGSLEVPLLKQLPSIRGTAQSDIVYLTEWHTCDLDLGLDYMVSCYMNYSDGYSFRVDNEWKGQITIARSENLTERIFYEYSEDMALATHELFRIKALPKKEYQTSTDSYMDYFKIATGEELVFLGKINPENKWRINEDIIKTRFNFIK